MNKRLFTYFTTDNISGKKSTEKWLSKNNSNLYNDIITWCNKIDVLKNIEFKRKVYHYVYKLKTIPVCNTCGGDVKYIRFIYGYSICCSDKCVKNSKKYKEKWLKTWKQNNDNGDFIKKRNKTVIEKYGSIDNYNNKIIKNIKNTNIIKYGVNNYFETDEFKNKRKESLYKKYGDEKYNNPDKTKKTRISNGTQISDNDILNFLNYKKVITNRTNTIYRNNHILINPYNIVLRNKHNHLDHKFSIKQGFIKKIPIEIITHPCNLEIINYKDNLSKKDRCSITIDNLLKEIINYDKEICFTHNDLKEKYDNVKIIAFELLKKNMIKI